MYFAQIIITLSVTAILSVIGFIIIYHYKNRCRNLKEAGLQNHVVITEDSIEPFIVIKNVPLETSSKDKKTRSELSKLKHEMDMFKMRNQFYEFETS